MMRAALVNKKNIVENVVVIDPTQKFKIKTGWLLIETEDAGIGDTYDPKSGTFKPREE